MRIRAFAGVSTILILSLVSVLNDYAKYSYTILTDPSYWIKLITTQVPIALIIFVARSLYKWGEMAKNKEYIKLNQEIVNGYETIYTTPNLTSRIDAYIAADNKERKKRAIEKMLSRKIFKLKEKLKRKKTEKVKAKLNVLEEQLANIDEIVDITKIKYAKISLSILFGRQEQQYESDDDLRITETGEYIKIAITKLLGIIAIGILFGSSAFFGFEGSAGEVIYNACIKLFQVGIAIFTGADAGINFVRTKMLSKMRLRLAYIQTFFAKMDYTPVKHNTPA